MRPNELHDYLLNLKNKDSQDPNIVEYKRRIRKELEQYRSQMPETVYPDGLLSKDVVFYSFMEAKNKPKIGEHEYKRLKLSWSSLRKHNTDIEVRFCYDAKDPNLTIKWKDLCDEYNVKMYPFHYSFTGTEPNAWCIHRWYNLAL